jgi:Spy/CpxP family protein refolding chaperone
MRRNALIAAIAAGLFSVTAMAHFGDGPRGEGPAGHGMMQGGGHGMGMGMGMGMGACMDPAAMSALNLSKEQREQIGAIQTEVSGKQIELMTSMRELRAKGNHDEMASLRKQMFEVSRQGHERIEAVLTAEQRALWRPGWRGFASRG